MEARSFKQEDLSSVVAQGNLSAILAGKRSISARLARELGRFFGVNPALFIADAGSNSRI
jgi:HTH-type transcriptional regulator/antitoxin HigA